MSSKYGFRPSEETLRREEELRKAAEAYDVRRKAQEEEYHTKQRNLQEGKEKERIASRVVVDYQRNTRETGQQVFVVSDEQGVAQHIAIFIDGSTDRPQIQHLRQVVERETGLSVEMKNKPVIGETQYYVNPNDGWS